MSLKIDVIIPVFNRVGLISRSIDSVLAQVSNGEINIIVIDDGSTDGTAALVSSRYPMVCLLKQENRGAASARNLGIEYAEGDYVVFLDSDDELTAGSIQTRLAAIEANREVDLVCCDFQDITDDVRDGPLHFQRIDIDRRLKLARGNEDLLIAENFFDAQLQKPLTLTSALCFRRTALTTDMLFDEGLKVGEDWELCLRFSRNHKVGLVRQVGVLRHLHAGNTINQKTDGMHQLKVDRKVLAEYELTPEQKRFMRWRRADNLYEAGYYLCQHGERRRALGYALQALWRQPSWKKVKLVGKIAVEGGRRSLRDRSQRTEV